MRHQKFATQFLRGCTGSGMANFIAPSKICYLLFGGGGIAQAQEQPLYLHHQDMPPVIRGGYHRLRHSQFNCTTKNLLPNFWGRCTGSGTTPLFASPKIYYLFFLGGGSVGRDAAEAGCPGTGQRAAGTVGSLEAWAPRSWWDTLPGKGGEVPAGW